MFCANVFAQNWTEPVQINVLQGVNNNADFCIDNSGNIHCVWSYKVESNYKHIYYSKSTDDGLTWTTPENVSQNTSLWMENPHIVSDSENNLHLTYDFNTGDPYHTLIMHRKFSDNTWSEMDTVSVSWPGARHNRLVIDHNNKLYCFWFHDYQGGMEFFRIMENNQWGNIMAVNDKSYFLSATVVDSINRIHCSGYLYFGGQPPYDQKIVYSYYENGIWSNLTEISRDYEPWAGNDIALDNDMNPHIVWRQAVNDSIPPNDGTLYSAFDGNNWTIPTIIVEDPSDQAIAIDKNNKVHIVDNEKFEDGYRLVHYQFINNEWVGNIIEEDTFGNYGNKLINRENYLYMISIKVHSLSPNYNSSVILRKYEITTSIENTIKPVFSAYNIYPNPSFGNTTISYSIQKKNKETSIKIYDIQGKLINTIMEKTQPPGTYQIIWNGTDKNGREVTNGTYLIRLQAGRQVMTRSVEIIK